MKAPRIITLPDEWGSPAAELANGFVREVSAALEGEVTVEDNIRAVFKDIEVDGGDIDVDVSTPWPDPPKAALVTYVADVSDGTPASTLLPWKPVQGGLQIASFPGLTSGTKYSLRLWIIGG